MPSEAVLWSASAGLSEPQNLERVMAFLRGRFPALSNTFFTTGADIWNYGATTAETEGIVRAAEAQTAAIARLANEWKFFVCDVSAPNDVDGISHTIDATLEPVGRFSTN